MRLDFLWGITKNANVFKFYTCALLPFPSNDYFFTRDSGLLCRSLQELGVDSKVVLPECEEDHFPRPDVLRASAKDLSSSDWWRSLGIDAVAIITWGFARDTKVVRAAREAGLIVFLVADDGGGAFSPLSDLFKTTWRRLYHCGLIRKVTESVFKAPLLYLYFRYLYRGKSRSRQYDLAHYVQAWSPLVVERMKKGLEKLKRADNLPVFDAGYPVHFEAVSDGKAPEAFPLSVIAVARWDAFKHKRPHYLMDVCKELLALHHEVQIHIYGKTVPFMEQVKESLEPGMAERLHIHGFTDQKEILRQMMRSHVIFCPSASDAGPVPVGEALCYGCSVSGGGGMAAWAIEEGFGSEGPDNDDPRRGAEAIMEELHQWANGRHDRKAMADFWRERLDSVRIAGRMIDFARRRLSGDGMV